jgi:hypothetical protein
MPYALTKPLTYDNGCSCGQFSNCTTQANFIKANSSKINPIKGLKMGCTPSESFFASTLECFYDQLCINLIQKYTNQINLTHSFAPLSTNESRFSMNTTIDKLIDELFIEEWKTMINYPSYFEQCAPFVCSYTYIQKYNIFHSVTVLLGLQGGLTIVLQWISPKIVRIMNKLYHHRKKRINTIQPVYSIEVIPIENVNRNIVNPTSNLELMSMNVTSQYVF